MLHLVRPEEDLRRWAISEKAHEESPIVVGCFRIEEKTAPLCEALSDLRRRVGRVNIFSSMAVKG